MNYGSILSNAMQDNSLHSSTQTEPRNAQMMQLKQTFINDWQQLLSKTHQNNINNDLESEFERKMDDLTSDFK